MASEIAKAYVQIIPSARGIKGSISKAMGGEMPAAGKKAGGSLGSSLIGKVKGMIATAGIGAAFAKAISEGAAKQQSLGGIETLFKDSAAKVIASANQAYKTAGMSANAYMETVTGFSASLLQSLGGDTAKAADQADMALKDMSDNANKMGTCMEDIKNAYGGFAKQNYTMLDNLKLGYGGTQSEMERLLADAQKISGIKYDISNLSDVYSAIHVIQGELDITGTTAKEASSTISGSAASMKAAFSDLLANITLGEPIGDSLKNLTDSVFTFAGNLLPAVGNILMGLPEVLNSAFGAAIRGLNLAADNADTLIQNGVDLVLSLGSSIISAAPYLMEAGINLIAAIANTLITTDWTQVITDTINNLRDSLDVAAGEILGTDGNIVQSMIGAINDRLPDVLRTGGEMINSLVSGIFEYLPILVEAAASSLAAFVNMLVSHLPEILNTGKDILLNIVEGIRQSFPKIITSAAEAISSMLSGLVSNMPQILEAGFDLIVSLIEGIGNAMPDIMAAAYDAAGILWDTIKSIDWWQLGKDIIRGLINGIGAMSGALWQAAKNVAKSALNAIKKFLGINSPSRVMRDQVGKWIPSGVAIGIEANTKPLTNAMHDLSDLTTDTLKSDVNFNNSFSRMAAAPFRYNSKDGSNRFKDDFSSLLGSMQDLESSNLEGHHGTIDVLREIREAIYGINLTDDSIYEAAERHRRKQAVISGGEIPW